ncbi:MAG: hypothetical protein ACYC99_05960 [Candidatus Geothermincolia bacterium]
MILAAALWSPSPARAQVDVAIDSVSVAPASVSPGKTATVRAMVRRPTLQNLPPALKGQVEVEVEFGLTSESKPLGGRKIGLGPGQSQAVEFAWVARAGKHVFRVRIARVTLKGQQLQDLKPGNDERLSGQFSVPAAAPPAAGGPAPDLMPTPSAVGTPAFRSGAPGPARPPGAGDGLTGLRSNLLPKPLDVPEWIRSGDRAAFTGAPWLRVNGEFASEGPPRSSLRLTWDLPEDPAFPHVWVILTVERDRVLEASFLANRCMLSDFCFGESVLDFGAFDIPPSFGTAHQAAPGFERPERSGSRLIGVRREQRGRRGELELGTEDFQIGLLYSFTVVYNRSGGLAGSPLGWSNTVTSTFRWPALPPPPSPLPDFAVTLLDNIRVGPDAGLLTVAVSDVSGHRPPYAGRLPYRILAQSDPSAGDTLAVVEEGTVTMTALGVGTVRSSYRLPPGDVPRLVRAEVNPGGTVREYRRGNNVREKYLGGDAAPVVPRIHDVWMEQEAALWALIGVRWSDGSSYAGLTPRMAPVDHGDESVSFDCRWLGGAEERRTRASPLGRDNVGYVFCGIGRTVRLAPAARFGPLVTRTIRFEGSELREDPARPGSPHPVDVSQDVAFEKTWQLPDFRHDRGPALPQLAVEIVRAGFEMRDIGPGSPGNRRFDTEEAILVQVSNIGRAPARSYTVGYRMAFRFLGERAVAEDLAAGGTASFCFRRIRRIELITPIGSPDGIHTTASLTSPVIALGNLEVHADITGFRDDGGGHWSSGGRFGGVGLEGLDAVCVGE